MNLTNVVIIGCGYVGTAVARYWQNNPNLRVAATTTTRDRIPELEAIASPVFLLKGSDLAALNFALRDRDLVLLTVGAKGGKGYEDAYRQTAQNLVSLLPQHPSIKQIIYTGSYAIYGNQKGEWVDERSHCNPSNANQEILAETENILLGAASNNLTVSLFRLGGIYGPGRELVKIYRRISGTTRSGNGEEPTNWIHLEDIVGAIDFARQHQISGIYNLVDDASLTRKDLIAQVLSTHNLPPVTWDASQPSPQAYRAKVSNQKIKDAGYKLIHPQRIF